MATARKAHCTENLTPYTSSGAVHNRNCKAGVVERTDAVAPVTPTVRTVPQMPRRLP